MNKEIWVGEENVKAINEDLNDEYKKLMRGEPNNYSFLFMILNDLGLIIETE